MKFLPLVIAFTLLVTKSLAADPLPSWNDTSPKQAITALVGKLDRGLDEGPKRGWSIVSMKNDWNTIHPATK